jgi:aminoglycoside phosphotransferase family enzyme/predicted kinase
MEGKREMAMGCDGLEPILALLAEAAGCARDEARIVTTHISVILLAGESAFKLKRPVTLPYLDFSTAEKRLTACERELQLNRRTAPTLYRHVLRVTREADGRLALNGGGVLVEAVVEMARFGDDALFDRMACEGRLTPALITTLAQRIAAFHDCAEIDSHRGGAETMAAVLAINAKGFALTDRLPAAEISIVNGACAAALVRHGGLLDARGREGRIRRCHGDLHLRNICLVDGEPTLFDALEFDEDLATTDVLYDLAFVLMDLWHRGLGSLANRLMNRYLDVTGDEGGLPLLPFFIAVRAAVRAHVLAVQTAADAAVIAEARAYLALARHCLAPHAARLVAVGGLSGSGKSTVAAALADRIGPLPGARVLASDRIRKRRFGVAAETRLPPDAYRPAVSEAVYAEQASRAEAILRSGHGVVAEAVFDRRADRERIAQAAHAAQVPFQGLWLEARPETLMARVETRRGDPSDATAAVVRTQLAQASTVSDWTGVSAEAEAETVCRRAREIIDAARPGAA